VVGVPSNEEVSSSIHLLKGDIYTAMEVRDIASECYKEALKVDVFCYEAFNRLIDHHMLRTEEELDLIKSLPFHKQCKNPKEESVLKFLYNSKLKKYNKPDNFEIPPSIDKLHENLDVATCLAERQYYNCQYHSSFAITEKILKTDPYHSACLPLHVALLVELKNKSKLFYFAHQLVDRYPELPISWYAVGCYYLLQPKKQDLARRYLLKTTLLDNMFGPAWLALGHSFALGNEHDQAMAAYFSASQLMRGCHLPFLYIGLEYSVTNNTKLAEQFFSSALEICPQDPHVLHEMGVAAYTNADYNTALSYFEKALSQVQTLGQEISVSEWEPLLNNLGHVHRKLKNYDLALEFHQKALTLAPHSTDTYSALGLVCSYLGRYLEAIEYLHRSISLCHDDVFTTTLLDSVIEHYAENDPSVYGEEPEEDVGILKPPETTFVAESCATNLFPETPQDNNAAFSNSAGSQGDGMSTSEFYGSKKDDSVLKEMEKLSPLDEGDKKNTSVSLLCDDSMDLDDSLDDSML